ncbi:pollen-specific protein-like At4g18596 [Bidens hawaiensis]|uniref:pollen-specific protein-like At4g18596 n=1 Tax=Bidens hawaiensis TaxID=980011 RepID=UPI00404A615A
MDSHSHSNFFVLLLAITLVSVSCSQADASKHSIPIITVVGVVYCDACHNNSFSTHSYFLPGAEVRIDCKFKAASPRTAEQITFSVNRTTNRNGVYKLDIPSVDGINCAKEAAVVNTCRASLIKSTSAACNVPAFTATSNEFSVKSKQANLCIYTMYALSFTPSKRDPAICGNKL